MTDRQAAVTAFAPPSIGNFIVGFDVLGAAIAPDDGRLRGDRVTVRPGGAFALHVCGRYAQQVPTDPAANLVVMAAHAVARGRGVPIPAVSMTLQKGLPAGSGLGSSSASAVAGALAMAAWMDSAPVALGPFAVWKAARQAELLEAAGYAEAQVAGAPHLDNVAPCLLGGLQLLTPLGPKPLAWPANLAVVVCSPAQALTTKAARAVLPGHVPLQLAVAHAQLLASFVLACEQGDVVALAAALKDLIAEPYRQALVPGFSAARSGALAAGALACSLSGAGPALMAVSGWDQAAAVATALASGFAQIDVAAVAAVCTLDNLGARLEAADAVA